MSFLFPPNTKVIRLVCIFLVMAIFFASPASAARPAGTGFKIEIETPGVYRISGAALADAGLDLAGVDPSGFRIFHGDTEIACEIVPDTGGFDAGSVLRFHADPEQTQYSGTDIYWLYVNAGPGERVLSRNASPDPALPTISGFTEHLVREENKELWTNTPGAPESDYWFWDRLTSPETGTFTFNTPSRDSTLTEATLTIDFQGRSNTGHVANIRLNGTDIGTAAQWSGTVAHSVAFPVSSSLLSNANNLTVSVPASGNNLDVIYLNRFAISYPRALLAENNQLGFDIGSAASAGIVVGGFSNADIIIYDVTDPDSVERLAEVDIYSSGGGYSVEFTHPGGTRTYYAFTAGAAQAPSRIRNRPDAGLKSALNGADYLLITDESLIGATAKLRRLRELQGLQVGAVGIEYVYDAFSGGCFTPEAIRDFIAYAAAHWNPAPRYVLLVGDANIDYRDYFKTGKKNIVPAYPGYTAELGLTPTDNAYACISGIDAVPDIPIGRLPGHDAETVIGMVNKLIFYETSLYAPEAALFVSDDDDPAFEELNRLFSEYLPNGFTANAVNAIEYNPLTQATEDILTYLDQGMLMTNYMGHGDVRRWGVEPTGGGDFILEPSDLGFLGRPGPPTFVVALNCLNGYFAQSQFYSLAEEWLLAADSGAIACFAPSGLSDQWEHEILGIELFSAIFHERENNLGNLAINSKARTYYAGTSEKVLISFNLIGDPATKLAIYRTPADRVTAYKITAETVSGGTIAPAGSVPVFAGENESFTIAPASGYAISDLLVDGRSQGALTQYAFTGVSSDHTIRPVFVPAGDGSKDGGGGGGGGGGCFIQALVP